MDQPRDVRHCGVVMLILAKQKKKRGFWVSGPEVKMHNKKLVLRRYVIYNLDKLERITDSFWVVAFWHRGKKCIRNLWLVCSLRIQNLMFRCVWSTAGLSRSAGQLTAWAVFCIIRAEPLIVLKTCTLCVTSHTTQLESQVETDIHNRSIATSRQLWMYLSCSCKFLWVLCYIAELSDFCHVCLIYTQTPILIQCAKFSVNPHGTIRGIVGKVSGRLAHLFVKSWALITSLFGSQEEINPPHPNFRQHQQSTNTPPPQGETCQKLMREGWMNFCLLVHLWTRFRRSTPVFLVSGSSVSQQFTGLTVRWSTFRRFDCCGWSADSFLTICLIVAGCVTF